MKYSYINKMQWEEKCCYIIIAIVTVLGFIANTISPINQPTKDYQEVYKILSSDWWKSMIGIFVFDIFIGYGAYLFGCQRRNYVKWRKKIINEGFKNDGTIKQIRFLTDNFYELIISYFSNVYQEEKIFSTSVCIQNLDINKKIICDVYELNNFEERKHYENDMITINGNTISMSANPLKLLVTVHKKYTDKNFGKAHAENFRYLDEKDN